MSDRRRKRQPLRTCIACRVKREQRDLMRVTASKDGVVMLDSEQKMPGRGAYLCYRNECVARARKRDSLQRALRCSIPEEIWEDIECALAEVLALDDTLTYQRVQDSAASEECIGAEGVEGWEE
ncbi:MAG TPA: YlxR family protein [Clostridiaceae bacterium]|nr:YlxR family protein [Clostridiaceae bacterium]